MVIERKTEPLSDPAQVPDPGRRKTVIIVLNSAIGLLVIAVVFIISAYYITVPHRKQDQKNEQVRIIQIDVRNGCGLSGCAAQVTDILRRRGFDVVEVKNYSSFEIPRTMVVDRVGDPGSAERVAHALGVDESSIVRQFNNDYFVDVTVVVGRDYSTLKPSQINNPKEKD